MRRIFESRRRSRFIIRGCRAGSYSLRLRVDGVDSFTDHSSAVHAEPELRHTQKVPGA